MRVAVLQYPVAWGDVRKNVGDTVTRIAALVGKTDVALLPEMFSTATNCTIAASCCHRMPLRSSPTNVTCMPPEVRTDSSLPARNVRYSPIKA